VRTRRTQNAGGWQRLSEGQAMVPRKILDSIENLSDNCRVKFHFFEEPDDALQQFFS
jgi:hypothetical protein